METAESVLTLIAAMPEAERASAWTSAQATAPAMASLASNMPDVLDRLVGALATFEKRHGRSVKFMAMDFGDQYWGDIGQHRSMASFFGALREDSAGGTIARALAGVPELPDADGNRCVGDTVLGPGVQATGSVLIDVAIADGEIHDSVLLGTRASTVRARNAFDVGSTVTDLELGTRAGAYKVVSDVAVAVPDGERCTTVFLPEGPVMMRVHEDTDLRDKPNTYAVPWGENALSFEAAHAKAMAGDPGALREARIRAQQSVAQNLRAPTQSP